MAGEKKEIITLDRLERIVKKVEQSEDVKIVKFCSGASSERGENWTSNMIRFDFTANVNGAEKEYHWIGKFPPTSPDRQVFHKQSKLDEKETRFYAELYPALKQFIKDSGLEYEIQLNFSPCPYAELEEEDFFFFMENMKENGYTEEVDKKLGIDAEHVKVVLDELARFHSTSHAYIMDKAKQSSLTQVLAETELFTRDFLFTNPPEETKEILSGFGEAFRQGMFVNTEALEDPGEDFVGSLKRYFERGEDKSHFNLKERQLHLDEFNVLIHNDLWFNNMLFKYEFKNGFPVPKKVSLVDMANFCWGSPVIDLSYFFFMSLEPEMRKKHETEFLEFYHSKLVSYLEKFGIHSSTYPLSQLKSDYTKKLMVGLIPSMTSLTVTLRPKDQALDHSDFDWGDPEKLMEKSSNLNVRILKTYPKIRNWMRANFLEALNKGVLY